MRPNDDDYDNNNNNSSAVTGMTNHRTVKDENFQ